MVRTKLVPPDGGYGWIIACAFSLHHIIAIPLGHSFGLIFKDKFKYAGFSATDITLIVNTNAACTFWCGIVNGVLLKLLGYRKVALVGAALMTIGLFMTAYAETFTQYMIIYGFITAIGMGMGISAYPLAVNTYLTTKRTKAFGYAMTVSGIGPVLIPQLVSFLLSKYGEEGTMIILSAYASHAFISSVLLQPVKWHMKKEKSVESDSGKAEMEELLNQEIDKKEYMDQPLKTKTKSSLSSIDAVKIESTYSLDARLTGNVLSVYEPRQRSVSLSSQRKEVPNIEFHRSMPEKLTIFSAKNGNILSENKVNVTKEEGIAANEQESKTKRSLFLNGIINLFDLTLLKDWTFVNIIVGISLGVCSEKSFALLIPFIMQDYGLDTQQIATFMSALSVTDICFRFVAPYVSDFFKKPVRVMYLWSLVILITFRFGLLLTYDYAALLVCATLIGLARGLRTIYWMLVVPSYVPIERLASAAGLQSVLNGIVTWLAAPLLGLIKDVTGSFRMCILVLNLMTFLSILMWTTEFAYKKGKVKKVDVEKFSET